MGLVRSVHPVFQKNDHTAASLILYPVGWQQDTVTADNPIFVGLAGTDENSAIKDDEETFDPDLGAELYITNGDTLDWTYGTKGVLAYTPEGTPARDPERLRLRVRGLRAGDPGGVPAPPAVHARPRAGREEPDRDPGQPVRHDARRTSRSTRSRTPTVAPRPCRSTPSARSAGSGCATGSTRAARTPSTRVSSGGKEYYGDDDVYYHRLRGKVRRTKAGDQVRVWFTAEGRTSEAFTYTRQPAWPRPGADRGRRGLHGRIARSDDHRAAVPRQLHLGARGQRRRRTTSTTSTRMAVARRTRSACCPTTARSSGTPARTSSPARWASHRARPRSWPTTSSSPCATTSTRAASCSSPASTPALRRHRRVRLRPRPGIGQRRRALHRTGDRPPRRTLGVHLPHQRLPPVLAGGLPLRRRRGHAPRRGRQPDRAVLGIGHRRPVHGGLVRVQRP